MGLLQNFANLLNSPKKTEIVSNQAAFLPTWGDQDITSKKNLLEQYEYWTYKAIDIKAKSISSLKIFTLNENKEEIQTQQLKDISHFNSFVGYEQGIKVVVMHLSLTGSAFLYFRPSETKGFSYELIPLNPLNMSVKPNHVTGLPENYIFSDINGKKVSFELDEIAHIYDPDPANWVKSKGALEASTYAHNIVEFSLQFNNNVFGNMGNLNAFIKVDNPDSNKVRLFEEMYKEKFTGPQNAGRTGFTNEKFEYIEIGKSPRDLDFANTLDKMRDTVLSLQGVPVDLVVGGSTFANASEAQRILQMYTIKPIVSQIESAFNRVIEKKYNREKGRFVIENPVKKDLEKDSLLAKTLYSEGVITRNEAREKSGFDRVDGGDVYREPKKEDTEIKTAIEEVQKSFATSLKSLVIVKQKEVDNLLAKKYFEKTIETEDEVKPILADFFTKQYARLIEGKKNLTKTLNMDWTQEEVILNLSIQEITDIVAKKYLSLTNEELDLSMSISERLASELERQGLSRSAKINETTKKELQKIIVDNLNSGSKEDTIKLIKTLFDSYTQSRVETIATSEVTRIKNGVRFGLFEDNEFSQKFVWINSGDERVRTAHKKVSPILKGELFDVGGELMRYPGDPLASATNTIGCRCDLATRDF